MNSKKGKTYEDIYGERANEERRKRSVGKHIVKAFRTKWCECDCGGQFREDSRYPQRFIRGHNAKSDNRMQGKHHTEEAKQKNREAHLGKFNHKPDCNCGICKARRGEYKGLTKEIDRRVAKQAESLKQTWQNLEQKEKQLKAIFKGLKLLPNKPEKFLTKLFQKFFPNEWKYIGDGKDKDSIIGGRCPDFIHVNQKKIIEFFGDYHHGEKRTGVSNKQHEQERIDHFAKYGYQTLIIWEHELKGIKKLVNKLRKFSNQC